jgi:hypothetical protein
MTSLSTTTSNTLVKLIEYIVLIPHLKPLLNLDNTEEETTGEPYGRGEINYEEPDLSRGIEGVDYCIGYGEVDLEGEEEK